MPLTYDILWESSWAANATNNTVTFVVVVHNANYTFTQATETDQNKVYFTDAASGLPIRGSTLNIFPFGPMVLDEIRMIEQINAWEVKCAMVYRKSLTGYSGGPTRITRITVENAEFILPVIQQTVVGGITVFEQFDRKHTRPRDRRTHTVFLSGITVDAFRLAVAQNRGKVYVFSGEPYLFIGASATFDGYGFIRAEYEFIGSGYVREFAANSVLANAVALPALMPFEEYVVNWQGQTSSADPPVITKATAAQLYEPGGPLPGIP